MKAKKNPESPNVQPWSHIAAMCTRLFGLPSFTFCDINTYVNDVKAKVVISYFFYHSKIQSSFYDK